MAYPSGNQQEQTTAHAASSLNGNSVPEAPPPTARAMKHNPGISLDWTPEEQRVLEAGLAMYAADPSLTRYAKIAVELHNKTVREVALRARWMNKKENGKRRKDDHNLTRKSKDKKEKVSDPSTKSSHCTARPSASPHALAMSMMDNDDVISFKALGGPAGEILEENARVLNQISANIAAGQLQDNIRLFCQTRDNIIKLLNETTDMPELMRQMPPLPVKLNDTIFNCILPRTNHQMQ